MHVHIDWMLRVKHLPSVLSIEKASFEFPWSEEDFTRCLEPKNRIGMVAETEIDEEIVGFMIYELQTDQIHILNFCVRSDHRRQGVGRQMVEKLVGKLSRQRRNRIVLEIRETNLAAQNFFKAQNFRAVSLLHDYFDDSTEDAYVMVHRLGEQQTSAVKNRIKEFTK